MCDLVLQESCNHRWLYTFSMPSAACRMQYTAVLVSFGDIVSSLCARAVQTLLSLDVHHAVFSMLLALPPYLVAFEIGACVCRAGIA